MSSAFLTDPVMFSVAVGSDLATLPHDAATWGAAHFVLMFVVLMFAGLFVQGPDLPELVVMLRGLHIDIINQTLVPHGQSTGNHSL